MILALAFAKHSSHSWGGSGSEVAWLFAAGVLSFWNEIICGSFCNLRFSFAERDFQGPNGTVGHNEHGIEKESADS